MAKKTKGIILNLKGNINLKIQLDPETTYNLRVSNLKINSLLNDFLKERGVMQDKNLPENQKYIIRGGSDISGCPMHHSINTKGAKKIFSKNATKKKRVVSKYITEKTRVLDILVSVKD